MKRIIALILVVATCLSMCACNLFAKVTCEECGEKNSESSSFCKSCGKSIGQKTNSNDTDSGVINIRADDFDTAKYVGYWGINDGREKQLIINQQVSTTVYFSLQYYMGAELNDCAAKLKENVASFSIADDQAVIKGNLEFHSDTITVNITHSTNGGMPVETMEFNRKYGEKIFNNSEVTSTDIPEITTVPPVTAAQRPTGTDPTSILPHSSTRLLTSSDLYYLNASQLRIARNEIYARHGRMFDDVSLQNYFNTKSWYTPRISAKNFSSSVLSSVEKQNIEYIEYWEKYGYGPSSTPTYTAKTQTSGYILPQSSTRLLTYSDIRGLSSYQLKLARNEIYARHGRMFTDSSLQSYFNSKSWYTPRISAKNFKSSMLSSIEKKNIEFIQSYE